jgi:hypothetical protein
MAIFQYHGDCTNLNIWLGISYMKKSAVDLLCTFLYQVRQTHTPTHPPTHTHTHTHTTHPPTHTHTHTHTHKALRVHEDVTVLEIKG